MLDPGGDRDNRDRYPRRHAVLRLTWVHDRLAHVLEHCDTGEPSGTWTGRACPDHGLALGADIDTTTVRQLSTCGQLADMIWEAPPA
jgi:hypothetical protein